MIHRAASCRRPFTAAVAGGVAALLLLSLTPLSASAQPSERSEPPLAAVVQPPDPERDPYAGHRPEGSHGYDGEAPAPATDGGSGEPRSAEPAPAGEPAAGLTPGDVVEADAFHRVVVGENGTLEGEFFPAPVFYDEPGQGYVPIDLTLEASQDENWVRPVRGPASVARIATSLEPGSSSVRLGSPVGEVVVRHPEVVARRDGQVESGKVPSSKPADVSSGRPQSGEQAMVSPMDPDASGDPGAAPRPAVFVRNALSGGRDLVTEPTVDGFKQSVVLHDRQARPAYETEFELPAGVIARDGGSGVEFVGADGDVVASFGGGMAFDNATPVRAEVPVTTRLVRQNGSRAVVASGADPVWVKAPQRVLPITIDPTYTDWSQLLSYAAASDECQGWGDFIPCDTYVNSDNFTGKYYAQTELRTGSPGAYQQGSTTIRNDTMSYVKFYTDSIGSSCHRFNVQSASLSMYAYEGSASSEYFYAQRALSSPLSTTDWSSRPSGTTTGQGSLYKTGTGSMVFNVTYVADQWFEGLATNHGFRVSAGSGTPSLAGFRKYRSGNSGYSTAPKLIVRYDHRPPPCAVQNPASTGKSQSAEVRWSAAVGDGGSPITHYAVATYRDGVFVKTENATATGFDMVHTVTGLPTGTGYTFQIRPVSEMGTGPAGTTNVVTVVAPPGAPTGVGATRKDKSAALTWTAPASDGGTPIDFYYVYTYNANGTILKGETSTVTNPTITGLTNGNSYYFTVYAHNSAGYGPASQPSNTVLVAGPPGPPTGVAATAGVGSANLTWTPPTDTGGMPIDLYYVYTYNAGDGTVFKGETFTAPPGTVTGLTPGNPYYFVVYSHTQHDSYGYSTASAPSNTITPAAPDVTGPNPPAVTSTTHPQPTGTGPRWYPTDDIALEWTASDPSGIAGYSFLLDQNPTTAPSTTAPLSTATSQPYADRPSGKHWFHIAAKDNAGNWGGPAHFPIQIDTVAPDAPTAPAGDPSLGADRPPYLSSYDRTIDIRWEGGGTDAHSGFAGFSYTFDRTSNSVPDATVDTDADDRTVTSNTLEDGAWYLHVVAVDNAGNRSAVHTVGPFLIGEATLADALLGSASAGSDELGLEQSAPYDSHQLGNGTSYVQLRTGNAVTQQDLFTVPGQVLNTVARLAHNSHARGRDSGVGRGWNLSVTDLEGGVEGPLEDLTDASVTDVDINRDLTLAALTDTGAIRQDLADGAQGVTGRLLEFVDGDGTTHRFTRHSTPGGRWISPPGVDLKVREHLDAAGQATSYDLVRPDGVVYTATRLQLNNVDAAVPVWRVTAVRDRSGNVLTYKHENFGPAGATRVRLVEIFHSRYPTDPVARFGYAPFVVGSTNDDAGVLRSVTTLPGQPGERRTDVTITPGSYLTGAGHELTAITEAAHASDADGRRTTRYTYNNDATISTVTDPRGNTTHLAYAAGRPAGTPADAPSVPMLTTVSDRNNATTTYAYKPLGAVGATETTVTRPGGPAGEGADTTRYEISERGTVSNTDDRTAGGNVTRVTDAGAAGPDATITPVVTNHEWYANKLTKTTDGTGAVTEFTYNDLGLLTQIVQPPPNRADAAALDGTATPTTPVTSTLDYTYPAGYTYGCADPAATDKPVTTAGSCALAAELDRVVTAANVNGQQRVADFDYNTAGRLTDVIERADSTGSASIGDRTTKFDYYEQGALKTINGPRPDSDALDVTTYGDTNDQAYGGYHRSGQPLVLTDADGKTKTFAYSPYGMVTSTADRDGRTTTSSYDQRDNLIEATAPGAATTTYKYDSNDNKTAEVQPARGAYRPTTVNSYDLMDRIEQVEAPGADESAATPVKTVTTTVYNPDGSQRSVDGPLPGTADTTVYAYYPNRMLKEERAPAADPAEPAVTTHYYDAAGRPVRTLHSAADAAGSRPVEAVVYTPAGDVQQQATTSTTGTGNGAAGNTNKTVDVAFNAHGEPVVTLAPAHGGKRGRETTRYDTFGQPVETRRLADTTTPTGPGTKEIVSSTGYDLAGNTVRVTQATGDGGQLESLYTFDALNRLAAQTKDPVNPDHKTAYAYNGEGQQTNRTDTTASGTVLRKVVSEYNPDNTKRSETVTTHDTNTPADQRMLATCNTRPDGTTGYDQAGNLLYSRTVRGLTRTDGCDMTAGAVLLREQQLAYDDRDWLATSTMSVRSPSTGAMVSRSQRLTYHPNGSKASVTHVDGTTEHTTTHVVTPAGWESTLTDWRGRTTELTYLPNGSIAKNVLGRGGAQPGGVATADSTYKVDGTLAGLTWTAAGTPVRAHTGIAYDNRGLRVSEDVSVRQPGKTTNTTGTARYAYDLLDRLTSYTSPHPYDTAETRRPTTGYTLDDGGNITRELTTVPTQGTTAGRTMADTTSRYTNGRLTSRTAKQTVADLTSPLDLVTTDETYSYNSLGEETSRTAVDKYAGTDLTAVLGDTTSRTDTTFDAAGHTARSDNDATKPAGTPQTEIDKAKADVDYVYDTADRIISRTETKAGVAATTLFFYAGTSGSLIEETDQAGKTKTRYLLDGEGEALAQQTYKTNTDGTSTGSGEKWTWLLNDALGNTASVLDDLGTVAEQKSFDPFGKPDNGGTAKTTTDPDAPTTTLGFQSARTDETTGRVMLGQRQYDPSTARFTTPDTYVAGMLDLQLGTDSLTGNRYLFAGANPLAFYEDGHGMFGRLKKIAKASVPALQYVPIVSTAIDAASAATGRNFYEGGRKMSGGERLAMLGSAALKAVPGVGVAAAIGAKAATKAVVKVRTTSKIDNATGLPGPLWNPTKNRSAAQNAFRHYKKHGRDFNSVNALHYVRDAHKFLNNRAWALRRTRGNGDVLKWNPITNRFGARTATGAPKTYFRPRSRFEGWRQFIQ